jgi:hypothetical protein
MQTIHRGEHMGHTRLVRLIAYAIGVPVIALLYCPIFLKLWGELFTFGDSPFPTKPPISLKISVHVLGFPFLYLLNIESVERMALRILPGTEPLIFFTVLNGVFWGVFVVSIGLLVYRRTHMST